MEKRIKERFNAQILSTVMESYNITADRIKLLDGFESFIYEFQREGQAYILRISHSLRRDENLIRAEIDWINFLHRGAASVAKAIAAESGTMSCQLLTLKEVIFWRQLLLKLMEIIPQKRSGTQLFTRSMDV